mmetsp:Transcript_12087/g.42409  ORF Transcript_12087/g.42409 Transcript_12087/m.42409 type:complete len:289 (-) Transcript_12087:255-1121(-)
MARAAATSRFSSETLLQGSDVSQSRYVRVTLNSDEFFSRLCSFSSSSSMTVRASGGTSSPASRSVNLAITASLSSRSIPSSRLMLFSCSCRKYCRWFFEIFSSTSLEMSTCSCDSSRSFFSSTSARERRSSSPVASSTACSSSPSAVVIDAVKSARRYGLFTSSFCVKYCMCSLNIGLILMMSRIVARISLAYAFSTSLCPRSGITSSMCRTCTASGLVPSTGSMISMRRCDIRMACTPPGTGARCWMCAKLPMLWMASASSRRNVSSCFSPSALTGPPFIINTPTYG